MPDGGTVTTFTDITPTVKAAEALERANATLERRVRERTKELTRLNSELGRAKAEADEANVSKTRFVAAASHDILQPLNAARLYVTSLRERQRGGEDADLVRNVDASLDAVEEIFAALLDMSRLDTGAMKPELARLPDRRIAAAAGRGVRAAGARERPRPRRHAVLARGAIGPPAVAAAAAESGVQCHQIHDRGARGGGLPAPRRNPAHRGLRHRHRHSAQQAARRLQGFHRLDQGARVARGAGLGLSIVERIARVLECEVALKSAVGKGSRFSIAVPRARPRPWARRRCASLPKAGRLYRHRRAVHRQRARAFWMACGSCWAAGAAAF